MRQALGWRALITCHQTGISRATPCRVNRSDIRLHFPFPISHLFNAAAIQNTHSQIPSVPFPHPKPAIEVFKIQVVNFLAVPYDSKSLPSTYYFHFISFHSPRHMCPLAVCRVHTISLQMPVSPLSCLDSSCRHTC